ncbi:ABC transporter permease [Anaerocolumna cellulosilytica]|uniref:ABC transporter permease n=1 Tax=Anaerocolumna cellulosilytica TaxID=433286 RepID=A0A6S6R6B4_9FIRM|nr:ABC-2 family transporter protein [Anaerocolumna cellulosilytica]MBB5193931.1 ABC-2 type transport system permease protein [Anaerocolumna cellulosilytica]BCJ94855.1 ABC transporter permease [Anaerocolumna cellulosilytica]
MGNLKLINKVAKLHFKITLQQDMAFRIDFFGKLLNTILAVVGNIAGILILFSQVNTINGWGLYETLTVTGVFMFVQSLKNLVIAPSLSSISGLGGELWTGSFDFTLLKPLPTQLYISLRNWSPFSIIDVILSLIIMGISVFNISSNISVINILLFLFALLMGLVILYSVMLLMTSAAFWYLGTPLLWIFDSFMELGRYPVRIYPTFIKNILTWIIPVGLIVTVPAEALLGGIDLKRIIIGIIFAIIIYFISTKVFKISLKKYSSASS